MSGAGKSSLLDELAARGHRTVDTDYGDYFHTVDGERRWREDRISALLDSAPDELPGVLFVQGTTRNQVLFYPRFDRIVLLSAPPEILAERLATRAGNPYGKDPAELAETLGVPADGGTAAARLGHARGGHHHPRRAGRRHRPRPRALIRDPKISALCAVTATASACPTQ